MREGITIKATGSSRLVYGMVVLPLVARVRMVRAHHLVALSIVHSIVHSYFPVHSQLMKPKPMSEGMRPSKSLHCGCS